VDERTNRRELLAEARRRTVRAGFARSHDHLFAEALGEVFG